MSIEASKTSETTEENTLLGRSKNIGKYPDVYLLPTVYLVGLPYIIQKTLTRLILKFVLYIFLMLCDCNLDHIKVT